MKGKHMMVGGMPMKDSAMASGKNMMGEMKQHTGPQKGTKKAVGMPAFKKKKVLGK